ncbi:hypothetical protein Q5752_004776 [Cryptotrichosporon argae]
MAEPAASPSAGPSTTPAYLTSGSALIKALKAAADPPAPGGPTKIALARAAWDAPLDVARKADVLRDFVLDAWAKKGSPALVDADYHRLLVSVLPACAVPASPALGLVSAFLTAVAAGPSPSAELLDAAHTSFARLFPARASPHKAEAWADVFGALVGALGVLEGGHDDGLRGIAGIVCDGMGAAFVGSPHQKKIAQTLQESLLALAYAHLRHPALRPLLDAAASLLLPLPTLQTLDPLLPLLANLPDAAATLHFVPVLLSTYISAVRTHRYALFSRASDAGPADVAVADRLRAAVAGALAQALDAFGTAQGRPEAEWDARRRTWEAVRDWGGYLETDDTGGRLVEAEASRAAAVLVSHAGRGDNAGLAGSVLRTLDVLEGLDHTRAAIGPDVVGWCLASPAHTHGAARALLASLLRYHQLTHSLPAFFGRVVAAVRELLPAALPAHITQHLYTLVALGVLADKAFRADLAAAVRAANLGARRGTTWAALLRQLTAAITDAEEPTPIPTPTPTHAAFAAILSRIIKLVLDAGAAAAPGPPDVEAAVGDAAAAFERYDFVPPSEGGQRKKRKSNAGAVPARSAADDLLAAARLRVARSAFLIQRDAGVDVDADAAAALLHTDASPELRLAAFHYAFARLCTHVQPEAVGDALLVPLGASSKRPWSGRDADVTSKTLAAAAWTIVAERGLAVFEARATPSQLDQLAQCVLEQSKRAVDGLSVSTAIGRLLSSAETWELPGFRAALLKQLVEHAKTDAGARAAYAVLVRAPVAWLTKPARAALLDAAYAVDEAAADARVVVRRWLGRLARDGVFGPLVQDAKTVRRLVRSLKDAPADLIEPTLTLLDFAYSHICRIADRHDVLSAVLDDATESKPFAKWVKRVRADAGAGAELVDDRARAVLVLCERAMTLPAAKYAPGVRAQLAALQAALASALVPVVDVALDRGQPALPVFHAYATLARLTAYLSLPPHPVAQRLLPLALRHAALGRVAFETTAAEADADTVLAAYVLLGRTAEPEPGPGLDDAWRAYVRAADVATFARVLAGCVELVQGGREGQVERALGALQAVLASSVEGSGKVVAAALQDMLTALDVAARSSSAALLAVLDVLVRLVDSRTGLLKPNDLSAILVILQHALLPASLSPSPAPAPAPAPASRAPAILTKLLTLVLSVARHRADLVLDRLAPVVGVVAACFATLQRPRTQLGRAARTKALARLPAWVDLAEPEAHAHLLSRLLVGLCSARAPAGSAGAGAGAGAGAEPDSASASARRALAGPLAKHAPALLIAYARAAADPHAGLAPAVRRALEPGLFAVCEVVTAGGRAASRGREGEGVGRAWGLGEGPGGDAENEVWAALWIAWARARYAGRG